MDNRKAFNDLQKCCKLITLNRRRVGELERLELETRKKFAPDRNPYLFVTVNKETCLDGYSALRNFANASGAEYPQALTSGKLRKHIATISQIHNLDSCELEQLCSFLGHTMTTHQNFYRLPQELYQTAKLAKHLLKSQNETADIDNNLMDQVLSSDDDDENIVNDVGNIQSKNIDREKSNSPVSVTVQPKKINLSRVSQGCLNNEQELLNEENTDQMTRASNLKNSGRVKHAKVKWTAEQKRITKDYFKNDINEKKPPTKSEIEVFKELYPIMENKIWQKIKVFVYNIYINQNKKTI
ncbi:hypothetical protein NQ314_002021 [Rhamnusium bicolor]|uniref:Uncharacterized protein n=1 Tax=Rhamnusium bicolor TaxID=1586634 RepID=A0AAV8ZRH2_9CUCU|nr:hypothetical protein NQ314_002021 [Rhamnusium bicolor]